MGGRLNLADKKNLFSNPPAFDPVLHGIGNDGGGTPLGLSADRYEMVVGDSIHYTLSGTGGSGGAYTIALDWDRVAVDPTLKLLQLPGGVRRG